MLTPPRPLQSATDDTVRLPLWVFSPGLRKAVLHERRRRFGIEEERIDVTTLSDEEPVYLEEASQ
ncbi:hypothetical protein OG301_26660 [Streptomyces platensis]|uniref:hypothetical protein n=1 Tax=Streptomyces platensis TaxID=58346 RepID=UPI002ED3148B|nr:hypothetical protein OG301_26660 [Streptomyces platensis]